MLPTTDCMSLYHSGLSITRQSKKYIPFFASIVDEVANNANVVEPIECGPEIKAKQLRACGAVPSAAALSHDDSAEKTFEEQKIPALETLADAARLWIRLNEPESEEEGDDAGEADVEVN
ncbi:hypothetical protein ACQRIU_007012 [Beauveria bassiana]